AVAITGLAVRRFIAKPVWLGKISVESGVIALLILLLMVYLAARREVVLQTNARMQQNSGAAASVLFKLMADPATPPSIRARTAQCVLECANRSLDLGAHEKLPTCAPIE